MSKMEIDEEMPDASKKLSEQFTPSLLKVGDFGISFFLQVNSLVLYTVLMSFQCRHFSDFIFIGIVHHKM